MTKWPTLKEAAEYLKMGKSTVYKLVREDRLPAHKPATECGARLIDCRPVYTVCIRPEQGKTESV